MHCIDLNLVETLLCGMSWGAFDVLGFSLGPLLQLCDWMGYYEKRTGLRLKEFVHNWVRVDILLVRCLGGNVRRHQGLWISK